MTLRLYRAEDCGKTTVLIVVDSLAAEGTPRLAFDMSRLWIEAGLRPIVVILHKTPEDLLPELHELGVDHIILDLPSCGYRRYLALARHIFTISRKYRAVAMLSMPLGWHAFMAIGARLAGVRRVIAHVGNYPNATAGSAFRKFRLLVQIGRPFTDALVCCSHYVRAGVIQHFGIREHETSVIYNGLPLSRFTDPEHIDGDCKSADDPFIIGMVARLERHKDQPTLIKAISILRKRKRNIRLWLIGEGSRRQELEHLIARENLTDIVELLGTRNDVSALLSRMNLFAFSTTADEGLGIALIEAMAAGVPVIASDVGACREVLDHGRLGNLVTPADPLSLANAIDTLSANRQIAVERADAVRRKVVQDFSIEDMARRYAELLALPTHNAVAQRQDETFPALAT
jgi:glycosyltransferase involved in cell wall biosynthesis